MEGAFYTGNYRNVLAEAGMSAEAIDKWVNDSFNTLFYGSDEDRIYHPVGDDMGYVTDTGNNDARTEGMSYGMMMCVQLDKQDEFNRIWKWAKTYMFLNEGRNSGYFCWSNALDGTKNADGAAPDGEEYFAMALIFAANRWGSTEGIFDYLTEARTLLSTMLHKGENGTQGKPMWNSENHLIKFITEVEFTDPSYHLPHFYELFALYADECDRDFWKEAAAASRRFLKISCHPQTGLNPEYADYDGTPHVGHEKFFGGRHDWYYSDAYRTVMNLALDWSWFSDDTSGAVNTANNLQRFFNETVKDNPRGIYSVDGSVIEGEALHPVAMTASEAMASLAADGSYALDCVKTFMRTPLRKGSRRYYDNCLYMLALLALSGNYRIYR